MVLRQGGCLRRRPVDRYKPLHVLIERRARVSPPEAARRIKGWGDLDMPPSFIERMVPKPLDRTDDLAMRDALLDAGADPDASWDNGIVMVERGDAETVHQLHAHGAKGRQP